ncbi:ATP/GTP-binding protein, partial [Candidatus Pacearchaeota archaeon]|nr:ATP/GTP-binding protein [Candidatus Pacearchaeota archaeon]
MAGSGKSCLTASFSEWLKMTEQNTICVNLDPGVISIPYNPDIDARDYVDVSALMEEYKLGPNGALLVATDLIAEHLEEIRE